MTSQECNFERDIAILELIEIKIDKYRSKKVYISDLIYDLESFLNQLSMVDRQWKTDFRTFWSDIEVVYAVALDQGLEELDNEGISITESSLDCLKKMAGDKINEISKLMRDEAIQKSISLESYGLNDLAWSKENAKKLINSTLRDKIGILGGDVYKLTTNHLESFGDNWACEPGAKESEEEFYLRSKSESLEYIEDYPVQEGENIVFSIVFTKKFC